MIAHEARRMLRARHYGALGTLSEKYHGYPFRSITPYLVDHDGSLLIRIGLGRHGCVRWRANMATGFSRCVVQSIPADPGNCKDARPSFRLILTALLAPENIY